MNLKYLAKSLPEHRVIIGYARGVPVYRIAGAEGEGEGSGGSGGTGTDTTGSSEGTGEGKKEDESGEGAKAKEGDEGEKDPRIKELSDENARHRVKNRELNDQLAEVQRQLKEIQDKDKPADAKVQEELNTLRQDNERLTTEVQRLRLHNAVLANNSHDFHDPEDALTADFADVEIDKDGKVNAADIRKALDALVKKKPHLVKPKEDKKEGDGKEKVKTGETFNGRQTGDRGKPTESTLKDKYPALRR